jgi:hypothetical protein
MSAADKVAINNAPTTTTALMKTGGTMTGAISFSNPASGAISFAIGSANCAYIYYDGSFAIAKSSVGLSIDIASDRTVNFPVNATINGNQIYHAGNKPSNNYGWKLRQSYTTAGTTTWIAPDLYNGASYEAGIIIIGGGGGGAIAAICTSSYYGSAVATGGASGYSTTLIMSVTPGTSYSVVVGTGGPSVTATGATSSGNGYAGGTSSFNGVTAAGGQGGYAATSGGSATAPIKGASGGQGSDARDYSSIASAAPANGQATSPVYSNGLYYGGATTPSMCFNSFTLKKCLGAGGGASGYNGNLGGVTAQTTITLDDGLVAGAGATSDLALLLQLGMLQAQDVVVELL